MINWFKRIFGYQTIKVDGETIHVRNVKDSDIIINVDGKETKFSFDSEGNLKSKTIDLSKLKKEDFYRV